MTDRTNSQQNKSQNQTRALRKMFIYLAPKITEKYQLTLQKLRQNSILKSKAFLELKASEFFKKVNKIYMVKLRQCFTGINANTLMSQINKKQDDLDSTKAKDRFYEAKVKSLRVLSRQWKERKTQTAYKNKYFTPKAEQTPKMQRQKVVEQVYLMLRAILRNKYMQGFNAIKSTEVTRMLKSKSIYLGNYLIEKRRYLLVHSVQKLKLNMLMNRQQKHNEEISQLDTKLAPINDPQLESLKQKQQKLQSTLDGVYREKETITKQVDEEINGIEKLLSQKKADLNQLAQKKSKLLQQLQDYRQRSDKYVFSRQEIFYLIYNNFLTRLKLWMETQAICDSVDLDKTGVLWWLLMPSIRFNLDRIHMKDQSELNQMILALTALIKDHQKLDKHSSTANYAQVFRAFFFSSSEIFCTYQSLLTENKFLHKMIGQILNQNTLLINQMLREIALKHTKVAQQSLQIIQNQSSL